MDTILTRIAKIAEEEGLTITALEKRIGASKSVLSRALSNNSDIQTKWIKNLLFTFPRYSAKWLLTGEGSMINLVESDSITKHKQSLVALIKVDNKYYSANTLDELKNIITQIETK